MLEGLPQVDGVEHRMVEAGGVSLHVAEAGEGDPVVLLHGWPQHWYCWRGIIPRLAGRHRVICPDNRGFGWSQAPGHGYDPETFASDAVALLDALGLERVRLIGHDWGGFAVFLIGLQHPERVERIISINAPHPWPPLDLRTLDALWRTWYAVAMATAGERILRSRPELVARLLRADTVRPGAITEADAAAFVDRLRRPEQARASQLLYRAYMRTLASGLRDRPWDQMRLHPPTRLLFGARDFAISKTLLRGYDSHADDMEVELVHDSGHFLPDEKPEFVAQRALEFFAAA